MRSYGLSIDPGMSNGVCLFSWGGEQDEYFKQEGVWQFPGGAPALARFLDWEGAMVEYGTPTFKGRPLARLVVEKFTPRGDGEFNLTQKSVEPLRGEGVLIGRGFEPFIDWAQPSQQYFMGNSALPLAEKKKLSREFLKLHGLHLTGSMVGQPDADDAISAELHAIAWLRRKRHMPTMVEMFGPGEDE
ncbi:MAG TPA: hypothetical protein VIR33_17585 [Thermopolyspora sp.]|jgi:hypothetical protein